MVTEESVVDSKYFQIGWRCKDARAVPSYAVDSS